MFYHRFIATQTTVRSVAYIAFVLVPVHRRSVGQTKTQSEPDDCDMHGCR